jgi:hypothetical protein
MARFIQARLGAAAEAGYAIVRDTFFVRLMLSAATLWRESRFLSVLLGLLLLVILLLAGTTARGVFETLRPAADGPLLPGLAAVFSFVVLLELGAAGLMAVLRALLQLSLDTGRHRIGALLTLAALLAVGLAAWALSSSPPPAAASATGWLTGMVVLLATAFWFERAYRRPAYPGFRDFHADVVEARHHLGRAAHGG